MEQHYLLGEVARILSRRPHQISYLLASGRVPEPEMRIANKRLFSEEDVVRLSRQLKTTPDWSVVKPDAVSNEPNPPGGLALRPPFEVMRTGETAYEVRDGDGVGGIL